MRFVWNRHHHPVRHFLEHAKEGRIFDPTAEQTRFHRLMHARWNGPEESRTGLFSRLKLEPVLTCD